MQSDLSSFFLKHRRNARQLGQLEPQGAAVEGMRLKEMKQQQREQINPH